ncbi:MAG: IS1634 family transposase [Calditrichaeota bacterium]|nr:MAG: IS1634 family transposase [Calditrichota bacterium]
MEFGGPWLALELIQRVGLDDFLATHLCRGRAAVDWCSTALILVICRLCHPSSELYIAEHFYRHSALAQLLGVPASKVNETRLYRGLDQLLPHKEQLECFLKQRLGRLFGLEYDLLLYDVTSTYFEGQAKANRKAQYGYSRDKRSDCKQVCIALVVSRDGMPLGYEVFDGNRADSTTVEEMVTTMEGRYGKSNRIWVMDRGMLSQKNIRFLQQSGRRYIIGTPKSMLKQFEDQLLQEGWEQVREGVEVKVCPSPEGDEEVFILCRSQDRLEKEKAIFARFEARIEEGLKKIQASCQKRKQSPVKIAERIGRLKGANARAARLFEVHVEEEPDGRAKVRWTKNESLRQWATLSNGCYVLRSNVREWTDQDLWQGYIQLTDAESAFRIHKSDLRIRPIWHQREDRVLAHILVCFLAYVLWKTLAQMCRAVGLGDEPRRVFDELAQLRMVDVVLPTSEGVEIRRRCISRPTEHQAILLQRLGFQLPRYLETTEM